MKDDRLYLLHIKECLESIAEFTEGNKSLFITSKLVRDAVLRNLQTLSESATKLSDQFKGRHPEIPWPKIAGFRNVVAHNYLGIDPDKIWDVVEVELPSLQNLVDQGLKKS